LNAQPLDKMSVNITGIYVADSLDGIYAPFPTFEKRQVDDYILLSAKVGYEVLPGTVAYVRGDNLLDQDYTTAINYNNAGLTVFGGVQFALPAN
jgi:vitamin B12 transporter